MKLRTDRDRGVLSKSDRNYLQTLGDELKDQSIRNTRQRIRDRIRNSLEDFDFLLQRPQERDFQTISDDISRGSRLYESVTSTVAFCFRLVEYAGIDPEEIVEIAVRKNEPFAENVSVDIDYEVTPPVDVDRVPDRIATGDLPDPVEVALALGHGALSEEDIEQLEKLVDRSEDWGSNMVLDTSDPGEEDS